MIAMPQVMIHWCPQGNYHEQAGPLPDVQETTIMEVQELPTCDEFALADNL